MKLLWERVAPMLRCWHVLVPLKMVDGYESVCTSLERWVALLGLITYQEEGGPGVHEDRRMMAQIT
jgi:hypothetical protein